jgi:hypothetical protein
MATRVYVRCSSGHYFSGEYCPFDSWSSGAAAEVAETVERLRQLGKDITLAELKRAGLSEAALQRTIVIDFGNDGSMFEAISPREYCVNGQTKPPLKLGPNFK